MTFIQLALITVSCLMTQTAPLPCLNSQIHPSEPVKSPEVLGIKQSLVPQKTGEGIDVELTAKAAISWDMDSGAILYDSNSTQTRPIASLNKLLSVLLVRDRLPLDTVVVIPPDVRKAQKDGADIQLPVGEHATVRDLLSASLIASANDAIVTLADAVATSETTFSDQANEFAILHGILNTHQANSSGLSGGNQYSTAEDVKKLLTFAYEDDVLRPLLSQATGSLTTIEGTQRHYKSTDKLLGSYLPILAAKTGFTTEAGENLAIMTTDNKGHKIGTVILGSQDRFLDARTLIEWVWRNYTWPE